MEFWVKVEVTLTPRQRLGGYPVDGINNLCGEPTRVGRIVWDARCHYNFHLNVIRR